MEGYQQELFNALAEAGADTVSAPSADLENPSEIAKAIFMRDRDAEDIFERNDYIQAQ